ncbi:hypothetical protein PM082_017112 [Marasmius tenuissimus]|nr:hypothetical protein PM082_017112 [Marasmius tenuissimus]
MSSQSTAKTILITGANTGIGYELVRQLAALGHNVYLTSRSEQSGKDAQKKLKDEHNLDVKYVQLDVTSEESIKRARDTIEKDEGKLEILVNNAGFVNGFIKPSELTPEHMDEILQTNYYGVIRVTTTFIPLIRKAQNGVILNVSSEVGSHTSQIETGDLFPPEIVSYYSSKAILNAYTISLAKELKGEGIKVNSGTPGLTMTNFPGTASIATRPASEGAACLLPLILIEPKDEKTGTFYGHRANGNVGEVPW